MFRCVVVCLLWISFSANALDCKDKKFKSHSECISQVGKTKKYVKNSKKELIESSREKINLFTSTLGDQEGIFTLEDALVSTYNNNPDLRAARNRQKIVDENISKAISGFLPNIYLQRSVTDQKNKKLGSELSYKTNDTSLVLNQELFAGGASAADIKSAKAIIFAGQAEFKNTEQEVLLSAIKAYLDVIQARELLEQNRDNVDVLRKHLESTEQGFELGEFTRTDVAQSKARLAGAITDLSTAEGNYIVSKATFRKIIGVDSGKLRLPSPDKNLPKSQDQVVTLALKSNPQVMRALHLVESSKGKLFKSIAGFSPRLTFTGSLVKDDTNLNFTRTRTITNEKIAMLNLNIPIYQSGTEYSNVRSSKYDLRAQKNNFTSVKNQITQSAISVWESYQISISNLDSTASAIEYAQVAFDSMVQEVEVGSRTVIDMLDAEQDLFQAKVRGIQARINHILSIYQIKSIVGELDAKSLGLNTKLYNPNKHYNATVLKVIGF